MEGLTKKQRKFVEYYRQGFNGAESARKAGFSPRGASATASHLLKNEKILQAIESADTGGYSLDEALGQCSELYQAALRDGKIATAKGIIALKSSLIGLQEEAKKEAAKKTGKGDFQIILNGVSESFLDNVQKFDELNELAGKKGIPDIEQMLNQLPDVEKTKKVQSQSKTDSNIDRILDEHKKNDV